MCSFISSSRNVKGAPRVALRGFQRIHLEAGASQHVHFELKPRDLGMVTEDGNPIIAQGDYTISIGGGQPDTGSARHQRSFPYRWPVRFARMMLVSCRRFSGRKDGGYVIAVVTIWMVPRQLVCKGEGFMSESSTRIVLTRREALLLSASAGVGIAAAKSAFASDSVKTAAHQEPGNLSTPLSAVAKRDTERYAGLLMAASSPSRECLMVSLRPEATVGFRRSRQHRGQVSIRRWSTVRTARKTCIPGQA